MAAARVEENELATAVRDLRLGEGLDAVTEAELQAMFIAEERRVADAVVLAELLIPQLSGIVSTKSAPGHRPATELAPRAEETIPVARAAESGVGSTAIPDLLDAMLAADGAARRQNRNRFGS